MDLFRFRSELEEYGHRLIELQSRVTQAQVQSDELGDLAELAQRRRFLVATLQQPSIKEISEAVEAELTKLWAQTRRRIDELALQVSGIPEASTGTVAAERAGRRARRASAR